MSQAFDHGYALLIAVNDSREPGATLPDVAKDVAALHQVLIHPERCAYPEDHLHVIQSKDATRDGILAGLDWLQDKLKADSSGNTTVVIGYTGHGHQTDDGYYLIPYDINLSRIPLSALRAADFAKAVSDLTPKRLLVLLDCCHAAGMQVKNLKSFGSAIPAKLFMPGESGISPADSAKGFERLTTGSGRAVLSSSQATQLSWIRADQTMSVFTYHVIEALTGHAQLQEGAQEVLVSDVMSFVWRHVPDTVVQERGLEVKQEPDYQVSGNFAVALLLGGKGLSKGMKAPDPLEIATSAQPAGSYQATMGNINTGTQSTETVQGDKTTVGNITGSSGVAIGRGAQAHVSQGLSPHDLEPLFAPLVTALQAAPAEKHDLAQQQVEDLKQEVAKGKQADDDKMATIIKGIVEMVPGAVGAVVSMFASPILGSITGPVTRWVLGTLGMK